MRPIRYQALNEQLGESITCRCFFCYPDADRLLFQTHHFYGLLGLGPIVEGYTVLASKDHHRCYREIPRSLWPEMEVCIQFVAQLLASAFSRPVIYEHGKAGGCFIRDGSFKHCYHAHMNFIPSMGRLPSHLQNDDSVGVRWEPQGPLECVLGEDRHEPYLLFSSSARRWSLAEISDPRRLPSQYLRKVLANHLGGCAEWDWRESPNLPAVFRAREKLPMGTTGQRLCLENIQAFGFEWGTT